MSKNANPGEEKTTLSKIEGCLENNEIKRPNFLQQFVLGSLKKDGESGDQGKPSFFPEIDRDISGIKLSTELLSEKSTEDSSSRTGSLSGDQQERSPSGFAFNILSTKSNPPSHIKLTYDEGGKLTNIEANLNGIKASFPEQQFSSTVSVLTFELFNRQMSSAKKEIGDLEKSISNMILFSSFLKSEIEKGKDFLSSFESKEQIPSAKIALASIDDCTKKIVEPFLEKAQKYVKNFMDEYVDPKFLANSFEQSCKSLREKPGALSEYFSDSDIEKVIEGAENIYNTNCKLFEMDNAGIVPDFFE